MPASASADRRTIRKRVCSSPGSGKSCRRATSRISTAAETVVPWLTPCRTWIAVESTATATATSHARRRRRARPRAAKRSARPAKQQTACDSGPAASGVRLRRTPSSLPGRIGVQELEACRGRHDQRDDRGRAPPCTARACEQRDHERHEHRREVHDTQALGRVQGVARGDLPGHGERDARGDVDDEDGAEHAGDHRHRALDARPARRGAEHRTRSDPDGDEAGGAARTSAWRARRAEAPRGQAARAARRRGRRRASRSPPGSTPTRIGGRASLRHMEMPRRREIGDRCIPAPERPVVAAVDDPEAVLDPVPRQLQRERAVL